MPRSLLLVFAMLFFVAFVPAQDSKSQNKTPENKPGAKTANGAYQPVPVTAARQPNPVKATPESIASGKKIYGYDCALCHGVAGDGKGDAPKEVKIPDLTDPTVLKDRTDGELFYIVKTGHGDMPPEGDRVKTEQLWDLVNYVRSLGKKSAPESEKPKVDEKTPN